MKASRFWIEIVALGTAIACALALVIATLGAAAVAVGGHPKEAASGQASPERTAQPSPASSPGSSSARQQTHEGMVTCSRCGAKHSADFGRTAVDCSLTCVHGGATFALVDGDKIYLLDGAPDRLKKVAGQRARIVGVVRGNRIKVSSVAAAT
jgi:hypothetical protein